MKNKRAAAILAITLLFAAVSPALAATKVNRSNIVITQIDGTTITAMKGSAAYIINAERATLKNAKNKTATLDQFFTGDQIDVSGTRGTDGAIIAKTIQNRSLKDESLTRGAITDASVAANANISASKLNLSNAITGDDIQSHTITSDKLADGITLTTGNITNLNLGTHTISDGNFTGNWNWNGGSLSNMIDLSATGNISALTFTSTQTTGTAPFTVASATKVANLNADLLDDLHVSTIGGVSVIPATDSSGNLTLTNAKLNIGTLKLDSQTTAPSAEEGKIYYNSTQKTAKIYNTQASSTDEYLDVSTDPHVQPTSCPDGYVPVPGDVRYGTGGGFCIMKYEAKCDFDNDGVGDTSPATNSHDGYDNSSQACTALHVKSLATGYPIVNISQTTSISYCSGLGAGYHLITNNEWMTMARNIENIGDNWTSGTVGTDGLFRGHSDSVPNVALTANSDDSQGYEGTGQSAPSEQRRTFTLSNSETVWDIAGNMYEWIFDTIKRKDEPHSITGPDNSWSQEEFDTIDNYGTMSYASLRPGNPGWNSTQNMGKLNTIYNPNGDTGTTIYAFMRGGFFRDGTVAGLFTIRLDDTPSSSYNTRSFRCVYRP
ncbi:MAG: SUMF1/EgtB/PvdO family nonheme iron enzyme [Candidatus Moranbacteria bacterium]|nr:SUMF1/EgtB/PvdO family nonheme iron enzyme [Candidatus Moranbacteria bacterium]